METPLRAEKQMSDRVRLLRRRCIETKASICPERAVHITDTYRTNEQQPINIKRALALSTILDKMSIRIDEGELIVGNHSSSLKAAPIFPEYDVEYIRNEMDAFENRQGDSFAVTDEAKRALLQVLPFWEGKTVKERVLAMVPDNVLIGAQGFVNVFDNEWALENGDGHVAIDYATLLRVGLKGILKEINEKREFLDLSEPDDLRKLPFYQSLIIVYEAAIRFARRFSALARSLSEHEKDQLRRRELLQISAVCAKVPESPATSFCEAVQAIWFVQLITQLESNGHSVSIGRFDQFLDPFYEADVASGNIDRNAALEILNCFWIKLASITKLRSWSQTRLNAGYPMFQNLTIGGLGPDGMDAVNKTTYLVLDCHDSMRLSQPTLTARVHSGSPYKYLHRCAEVLAGGGGMPAFFNDDIIIASLENRGVSHQDALNYCLVGCVEPSVAGKWGGRYGASQFNLTKCLELAINGGRDPRTGLRPCPDERTLENVTSYDELFGAFCKQVAHYVTLCTVFDNLHDLVWEDMTPTPFVSGLVRECVARGRELKKGGAVYDYSGGQTGNIANVANSLAAMKKLVWEDARISAIELAIALRENFEGPRGEQIRAMLVTRAPKYGNSDPYVDDIAREAFAYYMHEVERHTNTRYGKGPIGGTFHPSTASVAFNVPAGSLTGATPDGRKAGTPLADVESPFRGTEREGPTGVIRSASRIEHIYESGGSILNLKFNESLFQTGASVDLLVALVKTYFSLGGMELQIMIISKEKLREAQKAPEKYSDLLVRVAGYSAYFVALDPEVQNDIIERTGHTAL